jgi:hypothetical protein
MTRDEHIELHCKNCGNCVVCNDDIQAASSRRYDSSVIVTLLEYAPDKFAVIQFNKVLYTGSFDGVLSAYRNRDPYISRPRPARTESRARSGKISAADKAANTAALLAKLKARA